MKTEPFSRRLTSAGSCCVYFPKRCLRESRRVLSISITHVMVKEASRARVLKCFYLHHVTYKKRSRAVNKELILWS